MFIGLFEGLVGDQEIDFDLLLEIIEKI